MLLVVFSVRRVPPFLSIFGCALFAGVLAWFTQPELVRRSSARPAGLVTGIKALYSAMANGFVSNTGVEQIDTLFSRGGMSSMLTTIWLVLGALSLRRDHGARRFPGPAHQPDRRARQVDRRADRRGHLHGHRAEHPRRRPVRRDRHAQPRLPRSSSASAASRRGCCRDRRGHRDRDLAAGAVEQLRRLHGGRARRATDQLPAVSASSTCSAR